MNAPAQPYFIHPKYQAWRTATPSAPLTFRLDNKAKEIAERIRLELLRLRLNCVRP